MNITIEKFVPLVEISEQFQEGGVIRGNPTNIIESCLKLSWDNPARLWTFRTPEKPPFEKLEAFMDRFELVFKIHEGDGNYKAAWWSTSEEDSDEYIIKGLFADLNPETGPDFFKRAADGPRLAIWFGGIHKIMDANKTNTLPYRIRPFLSTGHLNPLHLCNEFHISNTFEQTEFLIENFEEFVELTRKAAP